MHHWVVVHHLLCGKRLSYPMTTLAMPYVLYAAFLLLRHGIIVPVIRGRLTAVSSACTWSHGALAFLYNPLHYMLIPNAQYFQRRPSTSNKSDYMLTE
jgi:hypothetical protein